MTQNYHPTKWSMLIIILITGVLFVYNCTNILRLEPPRQRGGHVNFTSYKAFRHNNPSGKLVLFWTAFFQREDFFVGMETKPFLECEVRQCFTTNDRSLLNQSDAVIFHIRDLSMSDLPNMRFGHQRWIFFLLESPSNTYRSLDNLDSLFNWTMTYRQDSDIYRPYSTGIPLQDLLLSNEKDVASLRQLLAGKTKKVAWFVSNCRTDSYRELYVSKLRKHIEVDVYGACSNTTCLSRVPCYNMLARDYKFYLAFENSLCQDYVTEKFFNSLRYSVVPVVLGGANYSSLISKDAFINVADFESPRHLANYLNLLGKNMTAYENYFHWRRKEIPAQSQPFCDLCQMLNNSSLPSKSYENVGNWWFGKSHCLEYTKSIIKSSF